MEWQSKRCFILQFCIFTVAFVCVSTQMIFPETKDYAENIQASFVENAGDSDQPDYGANAVSADGIGNGGSENRISRGLNDFALNMNKAILANQNGNNIAISPLSIAGALTLLLLGSVGKTYIEIASALGFFNDIADSQSIHREFGSLIDKITRKGEYATLYNGEMPNVTYGSSLFVQDNVPIREQYEEFVKSVYRSTVVRTDFKNGPNAQAIINRWVNDATNGRIQEILENPPPQETRLIITNAMYFKGMWEKFFLDGATRKAPFTLDKRYPQQTIQVDMMANEGPFPYYKSRELGCMILGLPYKGKNTMLYAIKPIDAVQKNIGQIVNELTADSLEGLIRRTRSQSTIVTFPKMRLSSSYDLKSSLQNLGITSLFSSAKANLALLSPLQGLNTPYMQDRYVQSEDGKDQFIFSRLGAGEGFGKNNNCSYLFQSNNSLGTTCTTVETINNQNVTVVYKQIDDKIGRRIIKRSVKINLIKNKNYRARRQVGMNTWNPGLYVDAVLHKVDIDITETGTEAAAATAVLISRDGRRPVFTANEPFFFVIRDEDSKFILFSAIVYKPNM